MKYVPTITIVLFFQNFLFAQKELHPFSLSGYIKGKDSGFVYLNYIPNGEMGILDSCKLKSGRFEFKGKIAEPTKAWFTTFSFTGMVDESNIAQFYIDTTHMKLSATNHDFKNLVLDGSTTDIDRVKLEKLKTPIEDSLQSLQKIFNAYYDEYGSLIKNKTDSTNLRLLTRKKDSVYTRMEQFRHKRNFIDSVFIMQNPNSYLAIDILSRSKFDEISFISLDSVFSRFPKYLQESFPGQKIKNVIERENNTKLGSYAKAFTAVDSKGDTIKLSAYEGKKYVLLDFGASWCVPCKQIIPAIKSLYIKHNDILEILSIANQDQEDDWRKAITDDKMEWPQIIENKKLMPVIPVGTTISDTYFISTIPSLILIDKSGRIVRKYGGFYYSRNDYMLDLEKDLANISK